MMENDFGLWESEAMLLVQGTSHIHFVPWMGFEVCL